MKQGKKRIQLATRIGVYYLITYISSYCMILQISDGAFNEGEPFYYIYSVAGLILGLYILALFFIGVYNMIKERLDEKAIR
jgi:hypothetical protein